MPKGTLSCEIPEIHVERLVMSGGEAGQDCES